jgi:hypothetical protein
VSCPCCVRYVNISATVLLASRSPVPLSCSHSFKAQQQGGDPAAGATQPAAAAAAARDGTPTAPQQQSAAHAKDPHQAGAAAGKMRKPQSFADLNRGISMTAASGSAAGGAAPAQRQPHQAAAIDKATIRGMYDDILRQQSTADVAAQPPDMQNGDSPMMPPCQPASSSGSAPHCNGSVAVPSASANGTATAHSAAQERSPFQQAAHGGGANPVTPGSPGRIGDAQAGGQGLACVASLAESLPDVASSSVDFDRVDGMPRAASGDSLASVFAGAPPFSDSGDSDDADSSGVGGSRPRGGSSTSRRSSEGSEQIVWSPPRRRQQQRPRQGGGAQLPSRPSAVRFGGVVRVCCFVSACVLL